jgi:hypothetical protein
MTDVNINLKTIWKLNLRNVMLLSSFTSLRSYGLIENKFTEEAH